MGGAIVILECSSCRAGNGGYDSVMVPAGELRSRSTAPCVVLCGPSHDDYWDACARWVREWSFYAKEGLSPGVDGETMLDDIENMFLCLGNKNKWIDRMGEMKETLNPEWLCIRTRNPVNEGHYYPSRTESLEVIERFGEILSEIR